MRRKTGLPEKLDCDTHARWARIKLDSEFDVSDSDNSG